MHILQCTHFVYFFSASSHFFLLLSFLCITPFQCLFFKVRFIPFLLQHCQFQFCDYSLSYVNKIKNKTRKSKRREKISIKIEKKNIHNSRSQKIFTFPFQVETDIIIMKFLNIFTRDRDIIFKMQIQA